jgi:hypothetical protein
MCNATMARSAPLVELVPGGRLSLLLFLGAGNPKRNDYSFPGKYLIDAERSGSGTSRRKRPRYDRRKRRRSLIGTGGDSANLPEYALK